MSSPIQCDVYCKGDILHTVQLLPLYNDSKTFVDQPMVYSVKDTLNGFRMVDRSDRLSVSRFVEKFFMAPGAELETWVPSDWSSDPGFLDRIENEDYKMFGKDVNGLWKILGRRVKEEFLQDPERSSLLAIELPFMVPGGRFREFYYWDSYWIIKGLLVSDMVDTARNIIMNCAHYIGQFGFVPNGARVYFLNRSQPPMFSEMVYEYFQATNNITFIREILPFLIKEYSYWMENHTVNIGDHILNRYHVQTTIPRPESYLEDIDLVNGLSTYDAHRVWSNLASGAESGWDYSTRWFSGDNLVNITINNIIPVDLNSILYKVETNIAYFSELINDVSTKTMFLNAALKRKNAIKEILWNEDDKQWYDFDLTSNEQRFGVYPSNWNPLWSGCYDESEELNTAIATSLSQSGLVFLNGILSTSLENSGQQWDYPNAWPPLQDFIIEGLSRINSPLAKQYAHEWVRTNYLGWTRHHFMYEKYNALHEGEGGGGGEYIPQNGFGWTNGVILSLLQKYPDLSP